MICPNCGRRNSAGATFCSRCHQRLPLVDKLNGDRRRMVMVEPRGGGGSGAVVLAVALLAGFLFIGGAAVIYLSQPPASTDPTNIAFASGTPTLPPFVQPTATPSPTPTPTFILLPSDSPSFGSFTPLPTDTTGFPTPPPTFSQPTPTPAPTNQAVQAKFTCTQQGTTKKINCQDSSTGPITSWHWDFGDSQTFDGASPGPHTYAQYAPDTAQPPYTYKVTLVVTGPGGETSFRQKAVVVQPPPCDNSGTPAGCIPSPTPSPSAPPSASPSNSPSTSPSPSITGAVP